MRALFRLRGSTRNHPAVERHLREQPGPLGTLARRCYAAIRDCGTDIHDVMHDGQATACVDGAAFAYVGVYKAHVSIGFFQGDELADPQHLLQGSGRHMRHVKLKPDSDIDAAALSALITAAYANVKARLASE